MKVKVNGTKISEGLTDFRYVLDAENGELLIDDIEITPDLTMVMKEQIWRNFKEDATERNKSIQK